MGITVELAIRLAPHALVVLGALLEIRGFMVALRGRAAIDRALQDYGRDARVFRPTARVYPTVFGARVGNAKRTLTDRVTALEATVQSLTGKVDAEIFAVKQLADERADQAADRAMRAAKWQVEQLAATVRQVAGASDERLAIRLFTLGLILQTVGGLAT